MKKIFFNLPVFLLITVAFLGIFSPKVTLAQTDLAQELSRLIRSTPGLLSQVLNLSQANQNQMFTRNFRLNDEHPEIRQLQAFLNADPATRLAVVAGQPGSSGNETNRFGPATAEAVRRFQAKHSILITGEFDESTRAKANNSGSAVPQLVSQYKTVTVDFFVSGSFCENEKGAQNPFLNYRLDVTFVNGNNRIVVPGYFAGDGNGNGCGNVWRAHFVPNEGGEWSYIPTMYYGENVAVADTISRADIVDVGSGGVIQAVSASGDPGFLSKGMLNYVNERYLKFDDGEYFLKAGAGSPENFLAYIGFDGGGRHNYAPHASDFNIDPVSGWGEGRANNIIGAINYLSSQGANSIYMLTMNVLGDGDDVYPWISKTDRVNFDISKLSQWNTVFDHMDRRGMMLHLITQEQENDRMLNGGDLGLERKLYYRELVARFAHHRAVTWNLGEENWNSNDQRRAYADYIKSINPYNQNIVVHNHINVQGRTISSTFNSSLIGYLTGASMQSENAGSVPGDTAGRLQTNSLWVVTSDEIGDAGCGVIPDGARPNSNRNCASQDEVRKYVIWGNLMNGGAGFDLYFGYGYPNDDLKLEDFRSRQNVWNYSRNALNFFKDNNVPFWEMNPGPSSFSGLNGGWAMSKNGELYLAYLPNGSSNVSVNLTGSNQKFNIKWFDPAVGVELAQGEIDGGAVRLVAYGRENQEVVILITGSGIPSSSLPASPPASDQINSGFLESNGFVVMEVESAPPSESWQSRTSIRGYSGSEYYVWEGSDHHNDTNRGILKYDFIIENPGTYRVYLRSMKNSSANDQENDIWIRMENNSDTMIHKLYKGGSRSVWGYSHEFSDYINGVETQYPARFYLSAGSHKLTFSARSRSFEIDKIVLVKQENEGAATDSFLDSLPESPRGETTTPTTGGGVPVDGVNITVSISGSDFSAGQNIPLSLIIRNMTTETKNLTFNRDCRTSGAYLVKRNGREVFNSTGIGCANTSSFLSLAPNGSVVVQKTLDTAQARLGSGSYTIEGYLPGYTVPSNSVAFSIRPSLTGEPDYDNENNDGSGEEENGDGDNGGSFGSGSDSGEGFGGLVDPGSVERCTYPADALTFMLTEASFPPNSRYVLKTGVNRESFNKILYTHSVVVLGSYDGNTECVIITGRDREVYRVYRGRDVTTIGSGVSR